VSSVLKNKINKLMAIINPYINFNGNALEAFTFYKSVFGGEFTKVAYFKDMASAEFPVSESEANKIMHIGLPIGPSNVLMGNDVPEFMGKTNERENRSKISVNCESKEEADKIFNGLSVGADRDGGEEVAAHGKNTSSIQPPPPSPPAPELATLSTAAPPPPPPPPRVPLPPVPPATSRIVNRCTCDCTYLTSTTITTSL
jgi:PhnB protein